MPPSPPATISARARAPEAPGEAREPLFPADRLGARRWSARRRRNHHREPGGDHRRVSPTQEAISRPPAAHGDPPHLGDREGPDRHPRGWTGSVRCRRLSVTVLPLVERAARPTASPSPGTIGDTTATAFLACGSAGAGARRRRRSPSRRTSPSTSAFLTANMPKIVEGGWNAARRRRRANGRDADLVARTPTSPTRRGSDQVAGRVQTPSEEHAERVKARRGVLTGQPELDAERALHNRKHNKTLHEQNADHERGQRGHSAARRQGSAPTSSDSPIIRPCDPAPSDDWRS